MASRWVRIDFVGRGSKPPPELAEDSDEDEEAIEEGEGGRDCVGWIILSVIHCFVTGPMLFSSGSMMVSSKYPSGFKTR